MPLVTAAGYPNLSVPSVSPSLTPGNDYQQISGVSPDSFGAGVGRAESQFGATAETAARGLESIVIQQQHLTNQVAANNSTNYVMDEVTKVLHGDPNKPGDVGYYGLKGIDAVNARQTTAKQLDDLITGARSKLGNSRQQIEFDSETRRMRNYWMGEIGRHYDQQLSVSAVNSAKAGQDLAGQGMATAAANGDMAGFSLNVENMMKGAMREGTAKGWTQEEYDAKFGDIRSIATKQWVESRAVTDPAGAKEFLEHNKDALRGDEYAQLSRMVKTHADHAVANEFVNGIRRGGMVRGGATSHAIQYEVAGPHATEAVDVFKGAGWTDAAIQGALANGQNEGGFHETWKPGDSGTSFGHWQYHKGGELEGYQSSFGNDRSTKAQAQYLVQRMEQIHPGFGKITDPKQAADIIEREFERPAVVTGQRYQGTVSTAAGLQPDTLLPDTPENKKAFEFWRTQGGSVSKDVSYVDYRKMMGGGQTTPTPVNRTGLPPLADQFDAIDKSNMTPEQKEIAQTLASRRYTVLEADAARAERLKTEHEKAQVQQVADEVAQDVYSPNPKITPQAIANDPRLSSNFAMRDHLIRFVNDPPGSSVPTHQSNALAMSLIERMQPNYNKPDKITTLDQIMEQTKGLNRADWTFVNNQFKQQQQLGGETTRQQKAELLDNYKGQIVGIIQDKNLNAAGYARLYRYEHFVQSKLDEYQKAGKNPQELFDPNSPAFVAKPETLKGFAPSPQELLRDPQTGAAVDLTKYTEGDLIAAVKQGKVDRNLARIELARRIEADQLTPPPTVPIR
jgi:hypothetical protein